VPRCASFNSFTSLLPSQPEPVYTRGQPFPKPDNTEVSQSLRSRLNQPLLEPDGTDTPTEHGECSQPQSMDSLWDTSFRGYYVAVSCLKYLDHSATLERICHEYFRKLPDDEKHLLFLATSYFCTNAKPSYEQLKADLKMFIYDSMAEPPFPWSLDPFKEMLRKASRLKLSVGETAEELRVRWILLMVLRFKMWRLQANHLIESV